MSVLITIFATVIIFSLLVLIHEFGHFWTAKRNGIKVLEFGLGFPPKLFGKKKGDTTYTINAIPFGGFVRLYGEDSHDPRVIKDKESYAGKSPWIRAKVAWGGVLMNFLLAWVLLAGGFIFGMEPLIATPEDVMTYVEDGTLTTTPGVFVNEIEKGSPAEAFGLANGDRLVSVDGRVVFSYDQLAPLINHVGDPLDVVFRGAEGSDRELAFSIDPAQAEGLAFYPNVFLPRLTIVDVDPSLSTSGPGLQSGDVILRINDALIFDFESYNAALFAASELQFEIVRDGQVLMVPVVFSPQGRVYINGVFPGSAAEAAGFQMGDVLTGIGGVPVASPESARDLIQSYADLEVEYFVQRNGEQVSLRAQPGDNGLLGIALSSLMDHEQQKLTLSETAILSSITDMGELKYPVHVAVVEGLKEGWKISKLTALMFAETLQSIVSRFEISESVGGPVRIAAITGTIIQQGPMAVVRFMALLSLSLGVINLFPLPALDGGRLLFILVEVIRGKPVNAKWEAYTHAFGFIFLLGLIFVITYHDIVRLITG